MFYRWMNRPLGPAYIPKKKKIIKLMQNFFKNKKKRSIKSKIHYKLLSWSETQSLYCVSRSLHACMSHSYISRLIQITSSAFTSFRNFYIETRWRHEESISNKSLLDLKRSIFQLFPVMSYTWRAIADCFRALINKLM